jgi:long-chain acyl-CoA synthetase
VDSTPRPTNLADLVGAAAARQGDHAALVDTATGLTLTWAEFDSAVSAEARRLVAAGVAAGDRVVIRCASGPALAVAVFGTLRAGAVAVPVPPGDAAAVVAHCAPRALVTDEPESGPADVAVVGPPDPTAQAEPVVAVGGGEDIALLVYTSDARGVCLSHRAVLANRAQAAALRPAPVTPVDRVLLAQPLFHAYGLAAGLFQVCWAGATAVLPGPGRPDAEELAGIVARYRVSALAGVPSTYRTLLELPAQELRTALAGLRLCTCGGVPLPRPWATAFQEATGHRIVEGYGLTEAGPVVTSTPIDGTATPGSVGRPLPGVEMRLLDADGRLLAEPREAVPEPTGADETLAAEPDDARSGAVDPGPATNGQEPPGSMANGEEPVAPDAAELDTPDPATSSRPGMTDVRATANRMATDVRAVAERGVAEFRAAAERSVAEVRAAAERSVAEVRAAAERGVAEVRAAVRVGDPVGDMIDDAQDVEGPADPTSDAGRIALRGPNLFSGYWPGPTGGPDADGWFVTSDLGFLDGAGTLHLVDRSPDLVVVSGFTVYPHEVERVLAELPTVADAAVVGVPDERTGHAVRAVVVRAAGADDLDEEAVRTHCRARLARFKVPAQVVFVGELPRTAAGRLARHRLADRTTQV